ncbi:type II toxin-antitoxin system VapC family toxin [Pendulispora albinea]|uniref:Type II toxin-antitoxin system VapC family toxin n=1 Tax=Pendulispora albinea TaxID=2741071 RepID=A0ABZ2LQS3_9BACT
MIRFFDTSAFVKRYVTESGTSMVRAALRAHAVTVARITYAELAAAIARAARLDAITEGQRDAILARLTIDFSRLTVSEMRAAMFALVPALVVRHPLRGYDAVQLAAALHVQDSGTPVEFWSADDMLCKAAAAEGLRAVVPT